MSIPSRLTIESEVESSDGVFKIERCPFWLPVLRSEGPRLNCNANGRANVTPAARKIQALVRLNLIRDPALNVTFIARKSPCRG